MHSAEVTPHPSAPETTHLDAREATLRRLFPLDYEQVVDPNSGLDIFAYNPETGEDGLLHTLAGGADGGGFHHEESATYVWPTVKGGPVTYVDRSHLQKASSEKRRRYKEHPAEPYIARAVVNGMLKLDTRTDPASGQEVSTPTKNSMFPKEYDSMAVLKTVKWAYDKRDPSKDVMTENDVHEPVFVNESWAPMLDGKSVMRIRLVLTPDGKKIRTAVPIIRKEGGTMKLSDDQLNYHLVNTVWGNEQQVMSAHEPHDKAIV